MWTIPNLLTIARICCFPFLVYLVMNERYNTSFILILTLGLTDIIDGVIARKYNQQSDVGKWLDPLADKLLATTIYASFSLKGVMAQWLGALVISRDVIISLGALILVLVGMKVKISPSKLGKHTTGVQIGCMALTILSVLPYTGPVVKTPGVLTIAFVLTAIFTVASGVQYTRISVVEYESGVLLKDSYRSKGADGV